MKKRAAIGKRHALLRCIIDARRIATTFAATASTAAAAATTAQNKTGCREG